MSIEWDDGAAGRMDATTRNVREMYTRFPYPGIGEGEEERHQTVTLFLQAMQKYNLKPGGKNVLDVGCGTGYTTVTLAKSLPNSQVLGVDISPGSLQVADEYRKRFGVDNLTLRELDVTRQPLPDEAYIFVLASGSLHHMSDPTAALRNIVGAMEHGGLFGLSVYSTPTNVQRYRFRDALDCLVPDRSQVETRNKIAREIWPETQDMPDQELADSLSHPCDRSYTFREIHDLCAEAGLEFLEWCNCDVESFGKKGEEMGQKFQPLDLLTQCELIELLVNTKMLNLFFRRA